MYNCYFHVLLQFIFLLSGLGAHRSLESPMDRWHNGLPHQVRYDARQGHRDGPAATGPALQEEGWVAFCHNRIICILNAVVLLPAPFYRLLTLSQMKQ